MRTYGRLLLAWLLLLGAPAARAGEVRDVRMGEAVERNLPSDEPFQQWALDPSVLDRQAGDTIEQHEVVGEQAETIKLRNVVPPIHFESGVAKIPPSYVEKLRGVLDSMRHLQNVRLHLVGHADNQPLSSTLAGIYGDNAGLSRERAGEVAEFLQTALGLPPDAISFEWAGDTQPIASNDTAEGRARNRRVEVEVWYDEMRDKVGVKEVVVPEEIKRVKVCRMETVCKLRYREGHVHRARVKNLVAPLHYGDDTVGVPGEFVQQIAEALHNLQDKQNVTVKFVGFTDDVPLTGRAERIYGTHLSLSKAQAHRVALAVQEALHLPTPAVDSDGHGSEQPVASNDTPRGRALNRRVEVEFWHDDPLQELPDEPQLCPDASAAEVVTKVYDPPWGRLDSLPIEEGGEARIPPGYTEALRRALADVADKTHVRLRFVGYTRNERLDRRTALVYGDDVGLSTARARRVMERIAQELGLSESQTEHEGRGYVQSEDVVNAGFLQGETSHVDVQVVYDELAVLDDYEGVDVTPITRELSPKDPLALNLMRITVDGKPLDDPGRSSSDIQRCTDVALEQADIHFGFDDLELTPRLHVTSEPRSVPVWTTPDGGLQASSVLFRMYTNYPNYIDRSEVRIFEKGQSSQAEPLAVVAIGPEGSAAWRPTAKRFGGPTHQLQFVLRAYDAEGHFDETVPQPLWLMRAGPLEPGAGAAAEQAAAAPAAAEPATGEPATAEPAAAEPAPADRDTDRPDAAAAARPDREALLSGYGESALAVQNIPLTGAGMVNVHGSGIPPNHTVWLAGDPIPVDGDGQFVAEAILPKGLHTVEVAVLDDSGNGELFLRDLELERNDWFYVGMADVTLAYNKTNGPANALTGKDAPYDPDSLADGRLAFYVNGRFGEEWQLKASADTREGKVTDIFSNFLDKSPESLFRRMDPDYHYPTFGDDGTVEETAPTLGKFYLKLSRGESHALWGNFKVGYLDNELAHVDRGLYGANLRYQTEGTTSFGEKRFVLDGFAAQPGTVPSREEFRSTGGSLYYLRRQDLLVGSERVRVEVRDKDSGIVTSVVHLQPTVDYDIDYLQGRILLSQPVASTVEDRLLVRTAGLSGDEAWLVVQYEYTPGFDQVDAVAAGGQGQYWLNDFLKLGLTVNRNEDGSTNSGLYAADVTLRKSAESWFKLQAGRSEGMVSSTLRSDDGGFDFIGTGGLATADANAGAYRADVSLGVGDFIDGGQGRLSFYAQLLDQGYSAPGLTTLRDTQQYGGTLQVPVFDRMHLAAKADHRDEKGGLQTTAQEVDVGYKLTDHWTLSTGVRNEMRQDDSPVVPVTQEEGERTDAAVQVAYDTGHRWRSYGFGQYTLLSSGDMEDNRRIGVGGAYRMSDRLTLDGEASIGDLGPAGKLGTSYQQDESTNVYLNYTLGNERTDGGINGRQGNLVYGSRTRLSDSSSVYLENRYQHSDSVNGLTKTIGMNLAPNDRWTLGANWESGVLLDSQTDAETDRRAGGARIGYRYKNVQLASGVEYRFDETQHVDGTWSERSTWLFRNSFRFQMTPDWRLVGKLNHSFSESSLGTFFDGGFTEAVIGYAYRPVNWDKLHTLAKYTYFYNVPTTDQLNLEGTPAEFIQKSHVLAFDATYDVTKFWSVGGKYAYRLGQVSLDRENPKFFDNSAHLFILRNDLRFLKYWELSGEGRMLDLTDLSERRIGALFAVYRYLGDHFKVGVGYNFTDFSEDLTDLSYDSQGVFFNLIGTL